MEQGKEKILGVGVISPPAEIKHIGLSSVNSLLVGAPFKLFYLNVQTCRPDVGLQHFSHINDLLVGRYVEMYCPALKPFFPYQFPRPTGVIVIPGLYVPFS